jgi:DNA-binding transcriptional ArsR family regulator
MKDYRKSERILKALANRRRLAIVQYLSERQQASVGNIANEIKLSFKSTSHHLRLLATADILEKEQTSTSIFYSLHRPFSPILKTVLAD